MAKIIHMWYILGKMLTSKLCFPAYEKASTPETFLEKLHYSFVSWSYVTQGKAW